jgi:hypothetical protein
MNAYAILQAITAALNILNSAEPDIAAVIEILTGAQATAQSLADADATEQADQAKIATETK